MNSLIIIPARAGSKGLPGKNTKVLNDKPLIQYTIEFAIKNKQDNDEICVTSNDDEVISIAKKMGINVLFKRPENLSEDCTSMYDVLIHAVEFYENIKLKFKKIILLQPTSPIRSNYDLINMNKLFTSTTDMVVSVQKSKHNPFFNLFVEDKLKYLTPVSNTQYNTRQESPEIYIYNGSIYIISIKSLKKSKLNAFKKVKKYVMNDQEKNIDIDTIDDFRIAEFYLKNI